MSVTSVDAGSREGLTACTIHTVIQQQPWCAPAAGGLPLRPPGHPQRHIQDSSPAGLKSTSWSRPPTVCLMAAAVCLMAAILPS
eukprot:352852-Chlamydomonas_euryale.AAC.2